MRCQHELLIAAKLRRTDATRIAVKLEEASDRADAHTTLLGGLGYGSPAINRLDHASTQVLRIRLRHPCWPPPSRKLESYSRPHGNPRFSLFGKRFSGQRWAASAKLIGVCYASQLNPHVHARETHSAVLRNLALGVNLDVSTPL